MKFLDCGTITSTCGAQAFPRGDGAPQAVGAATITLPTSAVDASSALNAYQGHRVLVIAGQGMGQRRLLLNSSTAYLCAVANWDTPRPDTASTIIVGVPVRGHDAVEVKAEHVGTATTGTWRLQSYFAQQNLGTTARVDLARSTLSATFQNAITLATSGLASSAGLHGVAQTIDFLSPETAVAKIFVETAPTANVEMFASPINTRGRMGQ